MNQRYQIQEQVSQGGVGAVFRAWDSRLQRTVAIKRFLAPELRSDGGAIDPDLMREATVLSAMQHPNIVSIYDVLPDEAEGPCVVMEYLNGKDLEHAVMDAATTVEDFYKIANQTLDALSNAHRLNLLHRDIKPANIQVTWMPNGSFMCKFVDFGLARFFEKPSKQTVRPDGTVMGSVYYMAPEQLERRALDGRTDLYSLGCVFYYVLSMNRPFQGPSVQDVITAHLTGNAVPLRTYRPQLPAALCEWVHWLMQRRPEHRPNDASEALAVLQRISRGQAPAWPPHYQNGRAPSPSAVPSKAKGKTKSQPVPRKRPASGSPLRWAVPSLSAAAILTISLFAWQRWQVQVQSPTPRTAGAIIAAAREAAAKANATASSAKGPPASQTSQKEPAVATLR
jgi:serine/threonine protein kinase